MWQRTTQAIEVLRPAPQIVKKIESEPTGAGDRPKEAVEIADSGAL